MHGKGTFTFPDGTIFEGEFNDGYGQGTQTNPDGTKYGGEFHDGQLVIKSPINIFRKRFGFEEDFDPDPPSESIITHKSTEKSRKRLSYITPDAENSEIYHEFDSLSKLMGFGDHFYSLSDWEQIKGIIESYKICGNDTMFNTWLINEFRYMEYFFEDKFKLKFAEQMMEFYQGNLTITELEEYFNNNVSYTEETS